jgi:hypothetical protein
MQNFEPKDDNSDLYSEGYRLESRPEQSLRFGVL